MKFSDRIKNNETNDKISILQLNIGKRCNLKCTHCHVEASAEREEMMDRTTFDKSMKLYDKFSMESIDITGGEPTIHKDIEYFIEESCKRSKNVILRSNLVGMYNRDSLIKLLKDNRVNIVASMPCYTKENVDSMRGDGAFDEIVKSLRKLNEVGYGTDDSLKLTLVYNPMGDFLPPNQKDLESDYKRELDLIGIKFTDLITITNLPVGCFRNKLMREGTLDSYMKLLEDNFNENTVNKIMCRMQVSVSYDGKIYDCDFNQMENLPCESYSNLDEALEKDSLKREIIFKEYCYACTAGAGSSCGGSLND